MNHNFTIFPLGDCAATIELGMEMNEDVNNKVLAMQTWLKENPSRGIQDTIIAYCSLTLIYDPSEIKKYNLSSETSFDWACTKLKQAYAESRIEDVQDRSLIRLGVCYDEEFATDLVEVSRATQLSTEQIIERHLASTYRVYMLGFLPGFGYLGALDPLLYMPRKPSPVPVIAGSVGIVSNQTGIYPLNSPGGWHIIGRTPVKMFDAFDKTPVKLKAGDMVQFYRIDRAEFSSIGNSVDRKHS